MEFKDHFSARAALYAQYRPAYPKALFDWIASLVTRHELVWDCATGNGQAAVSLTSHFARVIATDASEKQISMAEPHPSIEYRVATAYDSGLDDRSVDAVTVAQAIHWLEHDRFYREAKRVMRDGAAIVIWGYGDPVIDDTELNNIVHTFNRGTIEKYWRPERDLILAELKTIPFPFREVGAPSFTLEQSWTLAEFAGYLRTWSATAAFVEANGVDPVDSVEGVLRSLWGQARHSVRWPIYIRAGY
ncbi:MAG TPA: class I SAM-dependent methyltransferase [Gemmatimonadaceae bacterium]|nr:class I SAM-dependent methyltransferase [Gemmatimonadaceae bacterium]